jgi:uncharacterized membrane protein
MKKSNVVRSIVKGLSWRAFAAFDTLAVTTAVMFWKTGTFNAHAILSLALGIVGMELLTKTALFAIHERLWERGSKAVVEAGTTAIDFARALVVMDEEFHNKRIGEAVE